MSGFTRSTTEEQRAFANALGDKLGPQDIVILVNAANRAGFEGKHADNAVEEALLKHAKAILHVAPAATPDNVTPDALMNALLSEFKPKGADHGIQ